MDNTVIIIIIIIISDNISVVYHNHNNLNYYFDMNTICYAAHTLVSLWPSLLRCPTQVKQYLMKVVRRQVLMFRNNITRHAICSIRLYRPAAVSRTVPHIDLQQCALTRLLKRSLHVQVRLYLMPAALIDSPIESVRPSVRP